MMAAAIFVVVLLATSGLLLHAARGRSVPVSKPEDLAGNTRPVDLEAFRNLVDPEEEEFLRANLPADEFCAVRRERLRAAVEYVNCAAHNASILLRLGEAARQHPDPGIAAAGQQLVDSALRLRLYSLPVLARLYVGIALPQLRLSPAGMLESYQHLSGLATRLAVMQNPARAARVAAIL
ncbi:MAG: hypothetical protein LAN63_03715 [Acidobacteriia bacterium]|nr:hypothetical protein [Terriglobia bacterium]